MYDLLHNITDFERLQEKSYWNKAQCSQDRNDYTWTLLYTCIQLETKFYLQCNGKHSIRLSEYVRICSDMFRMVIIRSLLHRKRDIFDICLTDRQFQTWILSSFLFGKCKQFVVKSLLKSIQGFFSTTCFCQRKGEMHGYAISCKSKTMTRESRP